MVEMFVVGVGASAGGLEALSELFANISPTLGEQTCYIVAQHLSPHYRSMLVQILSKESTLPVVEAENNQKLQTGFVYITPPDFDIQITGGLIALSKPRTPQGPKPSVDILLASLAQEYGKQSIGIILSGTGNDGAQGIEKIKQAGGFALIQNPDTAKYDGMPLASLQTGLVDYSLPSAKIGAKLEELLLQQNTPKLKPHKDLDALFALLNNKYGTNFANYKTSTILRRIDKTIKRLNINNIEDYLDYIDKKPQELYQLYQNLLINVTSFFRDIEAFQELTKVLEEKLNKDTIKENMRVWVQGCSTGEEVYSLAMLLQEMLERHKRHDISFQIFATDLDEEALDFGRKALYSAESVKPIPAQLLNKYLTQTDQGYEIAKTLRSKILFSKHDVTVNPPFLKLDILSCRNLLIYLNNDLQRQIFPVFHYSLREEGILFLGKSESVSQVEDLFDALNAKHKIFQKRKFPQAKSSIKFGAFKPLGISGEWSKKRETPQPQNFRDRVFETFTNLTQNPYLVLNVAMDILETKGNWSKFMQIPEGALSLNINKLLRKELLLEVKNIVMQAIKDKQQTRSPLKRITIDGERFYIRIQCGLIGREAEGNHEELYLLILEMLDFEEDIAKVLLAYNEETTHPQLQEIEAELNMTREHLQTYIEEVETTNEELQSLNEELQSSNEELQSSNEELETSNEELQSSNEELQTAYAEIKHMNQDIARKEQSLEEANMLFNTLFEHTQQGTMLLEADGTLRLINREAMRLLAQVGILNIDTDKKLLAFLVGEFAIKVQKSIQEIKQVYQVVKDVVEIAYLDQVYYYECCFTPIKPLFEQNLSYITLSLVDITPSKKHEVELFQRDELLSSLLESNSSYLIRTDMDGRYTYVNDSFCQKFGFPREQLIGKYYAPTVHPEDLKECERAVATLLAQPDKITTFEIRKPNPAGGFFHTEWEFALIRTQDGNIVEVQGVGRDITPYKQAQKQLEEERNRLEMMIWGGRLGTWDWDLRTGDIIFNERWAEIMDYERQEMQLSMAEWETMIHPDDHKRVMKALRDCILGHTGFYDIEHRKLSKKGEWRWLLLTGKVTERDNKGKATRVLGIHQDITDKKRTEERAKISDERNEKVLETMQEGIVIQDLTGAIISCNQSAEEILGLTYEQMIGHTSVDELWRTVHEDGSPFAGEEHPAMHTIRTGVPQQNVIMGVHKPSGELTWIAINSQLLYHPDTKVPYAVFATFHDITKRKNAESALEKEKKRLAYILEGTNVGTWEWNVQTGETIFNERWAEIIGYTLEELAPIDINTWVKYCHPDDLEVSGKLLEKHFAGELAYYDCEARMRHKDGHWVWVLDRGSVHEWTADGKPLWMAGTHFEITERKQMETEIQESEQRYRQVVETQSDFVLLSEPDTTITFANIPLAKILGVTPEQMLGSKWIDFAKLEDIVSTLEKIKQFTPENNSFITENRDRRANGEWGWTQWINQGIFDQMGKLVQIQSVGRDVTENKQAEVALKAGKELLKASIEANLEAVYILLKKEDEAGNIVDFIIREINKEATKQLNMTREQLVGFGICELFPINLTNGYFEQYKKSYEEQKTFSQEYYIPEEHIGAGWYFHQVVPIAQGVVIYNRDISERKKSENQLYQLTTRLSLATQASGIGIWEYDIVNNKLIWDEQMFNLYGITNTSNFGYAYETWQAGVHPQDKERSNEEVQAAIRGEKDFDTDFRVVYPDGKVRYIRALAVVQYDEAGKPLRMIGTNWDITDRREAQKQLIHKNEELSAIEEQLRAHLEDLKIMHQNLEKSENSLKKAQETAKIGSWEFDLQTFDLIWSREHYRIFELPENIAKEKLYEAYRNKIHPEDLPALDKIVQEAQAKGGAFAYEHRVMCQDGSFKSVVGIGEVTLNEQGLPALLRGTVQDITERKAIENAIRQEKQRFQDIVNSTDGIVWEADYATFCFTFVSQQAERLFGYPIEEWYEPHFWENHIFEEDRAFAKNYCAVHASRLESHDFEYRFVAKDGQALWIRDIVNVVVEDNKPTLLRGIMLDITKQKNAELERTELLHRFEQLGKHTPGILCQFVLEPDGRTYFPYASAKMFEYTSLTPEELAQDATPFFMLVPPEDVKQILQSVQESAKNMSFWQQEYCLQTKDNQTIWLEAKSTPHLLENGAVTWYGYANDITERKKMEEDLYRLSLVAKRTSNAVVITDIQRKMVWINESFTQITGYTLLEVVGKSPRMFQFEGTDQDVVRKVNEQLAQQIGIRFEIQNKGKDGRIYWLEVEVQPLFDKQNQHTGFMAVQTDITTRKAHKQKIEQQNKALREIAFFQSHILRRPIANVMGLCSLIEIAKAEQDWESIYQYLDMLLKSIHETDEVIHQIVNQANEIEDEND